MLTGGTVSKVISGQTDVWSALFDYSLLCWTVLFSPSRSCSLVSSSVCQCTCAQQGDVQKRKALTETSRKSVLMTDLSPKSFVKLVQRMVCKSVCLSGCTNMYSWCLFDVLCMCASEFVLLCKRSSIAELWMCVCSLPSMCKKPGAGIYPVPTTQTQ